MKRFVWLLFFVALCSACVNHEAGDPATFVVLDRDIHAIDLTQYTLYLGKIENQFTPQVEDQEYFFQKDGTYRAEAPAMGQWIHSGRYEVMVRNKETMVIRLRIQKGLFAGEIGECRLKLVGNNAGIYSMKMYRSALRKTKEISEVTGTFKIRARNEK